MPPRLSLRPAAGRTKAFARIASNPQPQLCLFCSLASRPTSVTSRTKRRNLATRRLESTSVSAPINARRDLEDALRDLQKHAANHVNLSRIQLALSGLNQDAGNESVRIAILGLTNGTSSGQTAKEVLRLLLADPLKPEQDWEQQLSSHDAAQPLIIRVGPEQVQDGEGVVAFSRENSLLPEIRISSPTLNEHSLEILVTESNPFADTDEDAAYQAFEEAVLVPTVDIPTSNTGRYTPITTPVHKALLVTEGIMGAASIVSLPLFQYKDTIAAAVNLPDFSSEKGADYPFTQVNIQAASEGLSAFRESLSNAFTYEQLWFESNVPALLEWLKSGTTPTGDGVTKEPVKTLIASILKNTLASVQEAEAHRLSSVLVSRTSTSNITALNQGLADWAESAHAELQEQLDLAFTSRRWRKLGWWKLFWRVDDVALLSSEMLSQRFLPLAERNVIYLAGRLEEAGLFADTSKPSYSVPILQVPGASASEETLSLEPPTSAGVEAGSKWPTHIGFTRAYLLDKTVPALQALAQKLMIQSLSTSALSTALAALAYLSAFSPFEAGAVAALGILWSLRRLQTKWETAREYWQGEVQEEGRKAVRAVEASVADVLDRSTKDALQGPEGVTELRKARELVQKAEEALSKLK